MSSISSSFAEPQTDSDQYEPYRSLSRSAVMSMIFGLLSFLGLLFPAMLVVPLVGCVLGLTAMWSIRRFPNELTGSTLATCGLLMCGSLFASGTAYHVYDYITELPEDHIRVNFYQLQPDKRSPSPVSARAIELDGQKIFIKGYVHPGVKGQGEIQTFILVPDMGTCCFGGQPKLTDMIQVTLRDPHKIMYNQRRRKISGILKVDKRLKPVSGLQGVYYQLDAYNVK